MIRRDTGATQPSSPAIGPIERSMLYVQRRARKALSPWVQRSLDRATQPRPERPLSRVQAHSVRLLDRAQRRLSTGDSVVKANLGTVEPQMVQRFTSQIADRLMPLAEKHQPGTSQAADSSDRLDMPLVEGPGMAGTTDQSPAPGTPDSYLTASSFASSVDAESPVISRSTMPTVQRMPQAGAGYSITQQLREALSANLPGTPRPPSVAPASDTQAPTPPTISTAPRPSASRVRRVARVEEIDPFSIAAQNAQRDEQIAVPSIPEQPTPSHASPSRPVIQRQTDESAPTPESRRQPSTQQELPSVEYPPLGPNGEYSLTQRIRQARAMQAQRSKEPSSPLPEPPTGLDNVSQSSTAISSNEPATRPSASRPIVQRQVADKPLTPEPLASKPITEQHLLPPVPGQEQEPAQIPAIPQIDTGLVVDKPTAPHIPRAVESGPVPATAKPDPAETTPATASGETKPATILPSMGTTRPRADSQSIQPQTGDTPEQPAVAEPAPEVRDAGNSHPVVTPSPVSQVQRMIDVDATQQDIDQLDQPQARQGTTETADRPVRRSVENPSVSEPNSTEQATPAPSPSFDQPIAARAARRLSMPLTRPHPRKQNVQRAVDPTPQADSSAPDLLVVNEPSSHVMPSIQRRVETGEQSEIPVVSPPSPTIATGSGLTNQDAAPSDSTGTTRAPGAVVLASEVQTPVAALPALPLKAPSLQRKLNTRSTPGESMTPAVLPQVRAALGDYVAPERQTPRVTRDDFVTRAPANAWVTARANNSASLPLVQRKLAHEEPSAALKPENVEEIRHDADQEPPLPLVTKRAKSNESVQREATNSPTNSSVEPSPALNEEEAGPQKIDLDELADEVYPIIKRMLAVERERTRGR